MIYGHLLHGFHDMISSNSYTGEIEQEKKEPFYLRF